MLATPRRAPFSDEEWIYELKLDGFRTLVRKTRDQVELISRPGNPLNLSFPDIVGAVSQVPGDFIWDAELTVDNPDGRPSFHRLQTRAKTSRPSNVRAAVTAHPARLYVFDMLATGDRDLRGLPLDARKRLLRDAFGDTGTLVYLSGIVAAGHWVFEQVQALGLEGMVAKRLKSTYQRGRSPDWQKVRNARYSRPAAPGVRS
ncbi:DNA ligase [Paraburkholderia sp. BL10I2N1]|uniref:ATP-dependent DNA ligase n=1 Tax=Paraburkholderia sp. BL10I2N1 TaxID=1938796 RepID=UPI00105B9676|nr:DNA ligase [Paraburkholderia sp. BL10I2N1]